MPDGIVERVRARAKDQGYVASQIINKRRLPVSP